MRVRSKRVVVIFMALGAAWLLHGLLKPRPPVPGVTFLGWTTIKGESHALVQLPPATQRPRRRNFFFFEYYRVEMEYVYTFPDGSCGMGSFANNVVTDANAPATIPLPLPANAVSLEFSKVQSWIKRPWDNVSPPFKLPSSHFIFEPPVFRLRDASNLETGTPARVASQR